MFSSSLSERKSKSGVRVVENDVLRSQDETLIHTFKNKVSIRIGNEAVDGFLSFTSERLLFRKEDDAKEESTWKMFQIYFKSVCVHAIESLVVHTSSEEEEEKEEKKVGEKCLYLQVEGELDPLIVGNAIERSDEEEEDDSFEEPATEVRIFPLLSDDEEGKEEEEEEERMVLEEMFERMNECALLNPDTEDENENDENDDPMFFGANGMVTAETLSFLEEEYFTSEKAIREAGFGEKLDEFERKLVISEEDRMRFEDAEE